MLSMDNIKLIASAPNRDNIHYSLHTKLNLEELSSKLCAEFVEESYDFVKSVLFVRQYSDCSADLYSLLQRKLGANFTDLPGYPNISQFRQVEMFTRVLTTSKKQQIRRIMHWGLPSSIEEYVQESGRAGRDGNDAQAILFEGKCGRYACQKNEAICIKHNYISEKTSVATGLFLSNKHHKIKLLKVTGYCTVKWCLLLHT